MCCACEYLVNGGDGGEFRTSTSHTVPSHYNPWVRLFSWMVRSQSRWPLLPPARQPFPNGPAPCMRSSLVFDGHVHAIDREFYHGGDIGQRKPDGQFDLPRAKEGGLGAIFFSIFVTEDYYPGRLETKQALRMLDACIEQIRPNSESIEIARNASDIERIHAAGKIAAVLDIEGSFDLDGDPAVIRAMYRLGMRSVQLSAHNWPSNYADSCCSAAEMARV